MKIPTEVLWVVIASAGGLAKSLHRFIIKKEHFNVVQTAANMFVSGFSGLMFGYFSLTLHLPEASTFLLIGVGGYLGGEGMNSIAEMVQKKYIIKNRCE